MKEYPTTRDEALRNKDDKSADSIANFSDPSQMRGMLLQVCRYFCTVCKIINMSNKELDSARCLKEHRERKKVRLKTVSG